MCSFALLDMGHLPSHGWSANKIINVNDIKPITSSIGMAKAIHVYSLLICDNWHM